jgi:hypothetical protein
MIIEDLLEAASKETDKKAVEEWKDVAVVAAFKEEVAVVDLAAIEVAVDHSTTKEAAVVTSVAEVEVAEEDSAVVVEEAAEVVEVAVVVDPLNLQKRRKSNSTRI